jgi:Zn-dependent protease with chaperone function
VSLALATTLLAAIAVPHLLRFERASPGLAALVWMSALLLRALTAVLTAVAIILVLPGTQLFSLVTHWCWNTALPLVATHLGLDGHRVGDAALVLPGVVLAVSALSVAFGVWKAGRAVAALIQRASVGRGPRDSVIVGDGDVVVAAAGIRRPQVLVSAGALTSLDDDELAASLDHEHGHIERRHRYILLVAELCRALARFLPGTRRAAQELRFHLERDADRFALERDHEPLVLASAICKAAQGRTTASVAALGGGGVSRRIRALLDGGAMSQPTNGLALRSAAALILGLVVMLTATLPAVTVAAVRSTGEAPAVRHCKNS